MDIALILDRLVPNADYQGSVTANDEDSFDAITWNDERVKPSWQDILDEWDVYQAELLKPLLAEYRWQKEVGGVIISELNVPTDDRSKLLINGAYNKAIEENNPTAEKSFKIAPGTFIQLTNAQIIAIALAVADHVQKCFTSESVVNSLIDDEEVTTEQEVYDAFDAAYNSEE